MRQALKRVLACALAVVLFVGIMPLSALTVTANAAENSATSSLANVNITVITDEESTLAPGVTMNELVAYDKNGDRIEMYLTTSDPSVDTVQFYANYKNNQCAEWGMQTLSEQVSAMEANYEEPFKVVAGLNASYYNTTSGAPTGAFVMEGVDMSTSGNDYSFFAVLKDGTVMIGSKGEYANYKGQIKEAIGGWIHLVKDGAICSGLDASTKYPRQTIGITADGKVITMTADGSQAPQTIGLTVYEQAEVMLALGCVEAIHLDGGNSATFGAVREGAEEFTTVNSPSGGAERAVSNTLMIVSTAVADGTFDHAVISGDYEYFVSNSSYTFSAIGVDASNAPADGIPESVTWTLSDDSFGTIEDGTFVSNGKLGDVDIQMSDNGKVVGSKTIHVVTPTAISFDSDETTVPYGKTAPLTVIAMYGNNEAYCSADAFDWTVSPAGAGTLNGFQFTAASDESVSEAVVTAAYKYDTSVAAASITVKFGKGSEVLFDFEDGDISNWRGTETIGEWIDAENAKYTDATYPIVKPESYSNQIEKTNTGIFLASEENGGKVKSGDYALGLTIDRLNAQGVGGWIYNYLYYTGETQIWRDVVNGKSAVRVGMWVNMPQNATNTAFRICRTFTKDSTGKLYTNYDYMMSDYDGAKVSYNTNYGIPESGWIYLYFDLTAYDFQSSLQYNPNENYAVNNGKGANGDYFPAFIQFINGTSADDDTMEELVLYIDDITLDFSEVTEDRDAPVISEMSVCEDTANFAALNGQTVTNNLLSFSAKIADASDNSNATGLDYTTAKIYVDGMDVSGNAGFKAASGTMSLTDVYLTNGAHSIAFVVCDKQGNETRVTRNLTVNGTAGNALVSLTGHNDGSHTPKAGSVYYIDVKASDASQIEAITTTLKLNTANTFEYEHIICANGVTASAQYDELDHELTVTINHDGTLTGEAVLASIPVRVWAWDEEATGITAQTQFNSGSIPIIDIECNTVFGEITYAGNTYDSYIAGFHAAMDIATELDNSTAWHAHTAEAAEDKAASCTSAGYTGRTYCNGCASVIDWGTATESTGHIYELNAENLMACKDCGVLLTGIADGKNYVDGVLVGDGWDGDSYYKDGVLLTGVNLVPSPEDPSVSYYYDFGTDGVCANRVKYTGLLQKEDGKYYYAQVGELKGGWNMIGEDWYYFDPDTLAAASGSVEVGVITYEFEETGRLVSGVWANTLFGTRYYYGPGYHKTGWYNIDGKDYFFDNGYRLEDGWQLTLESQQYRNWYFFDEDGACDKTLKPEDGFYTDRNGLAYAQDGVGLSGLREIDGKYYYFNHHGYAQKNGTYSNRLFKDDYAAYTGLVEKEGVLYYYENGITGTNGLYKIDGDYYYVYWGGVVKTNGTYYVSTTFCDLPAGNYTVGEDGKLLNGIVNKDGMLYLYVNGVTASNGLYKIGDDYYYSYWGGEIKTDGRYYVSTTYCDLPAGNYSFGADGRMLNGVVDMDGTLYLYINGTTATCGLFEVDGEHYYSYWGGVLKTDGRYYVSRTYCDLPAGNYSFGADGRMLDGAVDVDGKLYLYIDGTTATCGLFKIDGDYYYSYWGGELKVDGRYYVSTSYCDLPAGNYSFGADGRMLNGVVDVDGKLYLYINGITASNGLYKVDDDYYYSYWGGVLKTDGRYYVSTSYCDLPAGNYSFDAAGKMLNGVVDVDGKLYLYINGTTASNGLYKVGDDYYYSYWGGELKVDGRYYVGTTYCDLPAGNYTFGADGRMLNGFVTKEDGIYYYENGTSPAPGLICKDGEFYYVYWEGKLITNQTFYVSVTNGYTIKMNYVFDEYGRIVG